MGNPFATPFVKQLEHDVQLIEGFIAIDGSHNVIGQAPVSAPVGAGPYSLCKGLMKSVGIAGAVVTQPYQSTGFYQFTLDEPWTALLGFQLTLYDQGAVALPGWGIKANVKGVTTTGANGGRANGVDPGTDGTITAQTLQIKFRTVSSGALVDLAVSTGFWMRLLLKRSVIF